MLAFNVYAILLADATVVVTGQRKLDRPQAPLFRWRGQPPLVRFDRVRADTQYFAAAVAELSNATTHGGQFCWSYERKVARIEEQHHPLVQVIVQTDLPSLRSGAIHCPQRESRRSTTDTCCACHGVDSTTGVFAKDGRDASNQAEVADSVRKLASDLIVSNGHGSESECSGFPDLNVFHHGVNLGVGVNLVTAASATLSNSGCSHFSRYHLST